MRGSRDDLGLGHCLCVAACMAVFLLRHYFYPVENIKLLCVLASEDGLKHVQTEYPGVEVGGVSVVKPENMLTIG